MTPEPGTQVFDHVSDKVYFVGEEDKAWPLLPPPDPPNVVRAKDFEDSGTVEKAKNAAAGPVEREPLPLEEAKAVAAKFEDLRLGLSPEQVQRALGLETVSGRMLRYEGIVDYEGSSEPRHVRVCVLRDGYAFTLTYLRSATDGLALSEWLWRPDLDWPKEVTNRIQSLASLGNPLAGTQSLVLRGFAVEVKPGSFMPVAAMVFITRDKLAEASERKEGIVQCITSRLAGLTKQDLALASRATAVQLDIRSTLNNMVPGQPIRYVLMWFDVK